jgi:hypothetical protein
VYRSVFIDRFNDNFIRVAPCCQANAQLESVEGFDFTTSPYLTQLREQFDLGQQPSACELLECRNGTGHKVADKVL